MDGITKNEVRFVLSIFKSPETEFNANSLAKHMGISPMGALKIAKRLEKENLIISRRFGKANFFKVNVGNEYARQYICFLLKREAEQAPPYVKRWVTELKKIRNVDCVVLFGSVLRRHKEARDVDVLLITDKQRFPGLKKEIEEINLVNVKRVHPLYQTRTDFKKNIQKQDKPLLSAIKGIVVFGEDTIIGLLEK